MAYDGNTYRTFFKTPSVCFLVYYMCKEITKDLIEIERQRKAIYDLKCKEYKNHLIFYSVSSFRFIAL